MTIQSAAFVNASIFLVGIILLLLGSFPSLKERYPKLFLNGFLLTVVSLMLMVVAAFVLS